MLRRADIRFSATSAATASAKSLVLPLLVVSRQPTTQQALATARQVIDAFGKLIETSRTSGARLTMADPSSGADATRAGGLCVQQRSPKEAQVEVEFVVLLAIDEPAEFWSHAQVIMWATDLVQAFSARTWPKGVWVLPKRGRFPTDAVESEEAMPELPE